MSTLHLHESGSERGLARDVLTAAERATQQLGVDLRCVQRILTTLNYRMGRPLDDHDLADVVQDTVLIVLQKLNLFAERAPLEAWIYRICSMEIKNSVRRKRRLVAFTLLPSDEQVAQWGTGVEDGLATREQLCLAMDKLERSEAEVIHLKHFEGLTFNEIADRVHQPASTLKTRYYRAMTRLQCLLRQSEASA